MTTHETDQPQEIDHADEQAAEAEEAEPVAGYFDQDDATPTEGNDEVSDAASDDIDTAGLADPDADSADEAEAFDEPEAEPADETEIEVTGADDEPGDGAIALGPPETDAADESATPGEGDETDDLAAEPVVVELEETELEVLDEPVDAADGDDDESVLLTETAPGSVLPSEEDEEDEDAAAAEDEDAADAAEPSPVALLEPVGSDTPIDPGTGTYGERWSAIQGSFVDEPFRAVESAGALVAQLWHEYERSITEQRDALDSGWSAESPTDDLRAAFRQYRDLFNRLTELLSDD